jgi:hypothetical protein
MYLDVIEYDFYLSKLNTLLKINREKLNLFFTPTKTTNTYNESSFIKNVPKKKKNFFVI